MKWHRIWSVFVDRPFSLGETLNSRFHIVNRLGQGSYGISYCAYDGFLKKHVVIKQVRKSRLHKNIGKENLKWEIEILKLMDHKEIPKYIESFEYKGFICHVIEYVEGQDFEELIFQSGMEFLEEQVIGFSFQLLEILYYVNKRDVVHRDLRLPNVLLKDNGRISLIDFGLARLINGDEFEGHPVTVQTDFEFLGHFILFLLYSAYKEESGVEKPWYEELNIDDLGKEMLKRLLGITEKYASWEELRIDMEKWDKSISG
ncbi:protein kinase [Bacillus luti]|nr:serine/threonine-protein kinase [Bacillus cereus]